MKRKTLVYKTESEAWDRYKRQNPVTDTVSKPVQIKLKDDSTGWQVNVTVWSLD